MSDYKKGLARDITEECGGLPVAIAAVASTLKGKKTESEWKEALEKLKEATPMDIEKGLRNPYSCLQLSYDFLENEEAKSLFLLCSVFPEDFEIHEEYLARYGIGLGLFGNVNSYERARNQELPNEIAELKKLRLLDLYDCKIEKNPFEVIGRCSKLEELYFVYNKGSGWENEGKVAIAFLDKNKAVSVLKRYRIEIGTSSPFEKEDFSITRGLCVENFDASTSNATFKDLVQKCHGLRGLASQTVRHLPASKSANH
ncbi:hypothetical protein L6164_026019 [Bauhinia variegata]|uniref:Uncharacterized protein n=1 Tax=Bauhinia variegata TaxID=167791 RepID=A0ACB9M678_BAUVA|nr:hypothetical protein L6164_026019 [Bauhinia variegata]